MRLKMSLHELSLLLSLENLALGLFKRPQLGLFLQSCSMSSLVENSFFGSLFRCSNLDLLPDRIVSVPSLRFFLFNLALEFRLGLLCDTLDFGLALLPSKLFLHASLQLLSLFLLGISQALLQISLQLQLNSPSLFLFLDCLLNEIFFVIQ